MQEHFDAHANLFLLNSYMAGGEIMFIGRERELSSLEKLYRSDKFEFAVVYGRRRVGKTALLSHFIKDKNSSYQPPLQVVV